MAVAFKVSVDPFDYLRSIKGMRPADNPRFVRQYLREVAFQTQVQATKHEINRGGRGRPVRGRLTSRTGTGRRSIGVDLLGLPAYSRVGSGLSYMALHEFGGVVSRSASAVRKHTRTVVFGRKVSPFSVPRHRRRAHTANVPKRPWLKPAAEHTFKTAGDIALREWEKQL